MEKKRKKINFKFIVLILSLIVFLSMSVFTFAYFTDSKSYSGDLTFGSLELDVSGGVTGDGEDTVTSKLVFDVARKTASDPTWTGKIMPGDTIDINLTLGLKTGSEPAYYLISITDDYGVFENAVYFSEDGTNVYINDGTKTYKQGDTAKTAVTDKYCGKLTTEKSQNIKIGAKISENFLTQNALANITCKIEAIQQANLPSVDARTKLLVGETGDTNKKLYSQVEYLQGTGTQWIDTGVSPSVNTVMELAVNNSSQVSYGFETGARIGYMDNCFVMMDYGNSTARFLFADNEYQDFTKTNEKHYYKMTGSGNFYIDSELKTTKTGTFNLSSYNIYIFKFNNGGTATGGAVGCLYYYKIYENNILVRDFIPCVRSGDSKPGLYDTVSGAFFTNRGTGEFVYA